MTFKALLVLALAATLLACTGARPTSASRCAAPGEVQGGCAAACVRLRTLGCPGAKATPAGASCEEVCAGVQAAGLCWDLSCRAVASNCAAADACESAVSGQP